jgi:hypothetical protein
MREKNIQILCREIFELFPKSPIPNSNNITDHSNCCEDGEKLKRDFFEKKWENIEKEIITVNHGNLPLFTDTAYLYYFPAFLLNSLTNFSGHNIVLQFLVYELALIVDDSKYNYGVHRRSHLFSINQVSIIVEFLKLVLKQIDDEEMIYYHADARKALSFWENKFKDTLNLK